MMGVRYGVHVAAAAILLASSISSTTAKGASASFADEGRVQEAISRLLETRRIPGGAVSIRQGDDRLVVHAGTADVERNIPIAHGQHFGYRSVTKSFVTTVVLQLAHEGRIGLDEPVVTYVEGVPGGGVITVRNLAEMRSGLHDYTASEAFRNDLVEQPGRVWTGRELLAYAFEGPLRFPADARYDYSNTNTILLGEIITAATGKPWEQEVRERLTAELGLSSVVDPGAGPMSDPAATGYTDDGEGPFSMADFNNTGLNSAGALVGTLDDLEHWGIALGSGKLLSDEDFIRRLKSFGSTADDAASPEYDSYGFGSGEIEGWIGHTGTGLGFEALVMHDRTTGRTISILFNASNPGLTNAPAALFRELLAILDWAAPHGTQLVADGPQVTAPAQSVWTGLVSGPFGARAAFYATNGGLITADGPVTLEPQQDLAPAILATLDGGVALDRGGTINASRGGDGAFLHGGRTDAGDGEVRRGKAFLLLEDFVLNLRGNALSGTGVDVRDNGVAVLRDLTIAGTARAGLHAGGTSPATISGSRLHIDLASGDGVQVGGNGSVVLDDSRIRLQGEGHGVNVASDRADAPARLRANGLSVETLHPGSIGILAQGVGASVSLSDARIVTHGPAAHGIAAGDGARISLEGGTVTAQGPDAAAISALGSTRAAAVPATVSTISTRIEGAITGADGATIDLALGSGSVWTLPAGTSVSSHVGALSSRDSRIAFAPPANPLDGASYRQIRVNSYDADNTVVAVNAYLGPEGGLSDRVVIDGGLATGATQLAVTPTGGGGPTSGDGLRLVGTENGGRTAAGAFSLGGARVAAGAYEYSLQRSGAVSDDDWFLRSTRPAATGSGTSGVPDLRAEVPVNVALPALAARFGLTMLGTYHDRVATQNPGSPDAAGGKALWARAFGETGDGGSHDSGDLGGSEARRLGRFIGSGPSYDIDIAGFQAGFDFYRLERGDGARDTFGTYVGLGRIDSTVDAVYGGRAGSATLDGYSLGAYWNHRSADGWYLDAVIQGTRFADVEGRSRLGQNHGTEGWGVATSLEAGVAFGVGGGWTLEPQAQIILQHLTLDHGADQFALIRHDDVTDAYGRFGARVARNWATDGGGVITTWLRADLWQAFGDDASTTFTTLQGQYPVTFKADAGGGLGRTWGRIGAGISGQVVQNVSLFATGAYSHTLGDGQGHSIGGRLGVTVSW